MEALLKRKGGATAGGWGKVKTKLNITTPERKPENEFAKLALRMMKSKSEAEVELMEKKLKKKPEPRQKTEYELMKEKLRHVEFSDEEKGFLTKEQMEMISAKIAECKKWLVEIEREGKQKGRLLGDYINDYSDWDVDVEFLRKSGLNIDLDSLLQARKRSIIATLFYDPDEAARRAELEKEAERRRLEREAELEAKRRETEEKRLAALELERKKLMEDQEEKERRLREEEEKRNAESRKKEQELQEYAENERKRLQLEDLRRNQAEQENAARRQKMMRKFSTAEPPAEKEEVEVGKLNFDGLDQKDHKSRRRSVGKLENPWEKMGGQPKQRSRRQSKVGKLNSPYEGGSNPWSKTSSRDTSRSGSRRNSQSGEPSEPITTQPEFLQALAGLEDLAAMASRYDDYGSDE